MVSMIVSCTIDCADTYTLGSWWAEVLGLKLSDDDHPGDPEAVIDLDADGRVLLFIEVPDTKTVKNRLHFDIQPLDGTRDEEVERLIGLGATVHEDHRRPDGSGWVTMLDIEGNEFCVERSVAERAATA